MAQKKEYVASREVERAREAVRAHEQARPGEYRSEYDQALKEAMDRILNQKDFQYRLNGDALYRQYRSQAVRDARRAMSDTMGQAAALAGGYGSSYAQAVGQQAYARQLEGLADRIPELYSLAMEQYRLQTQGLRDKYDLLAGAQGEEYTRYRDSLAAWQAEADRLQKQYADRRDSDYGAYRDDVADWKWQQEFDENKRRYDQQWAADHPAAAPAAAPVSSAPKAAAKKTASVLGTVLGAVMGAAARRRKR